MPPEQRGWIRLAIHAAYELASCDLVTGLSAAPYNTEVQQRLLYCDMTTGPDGDYVRHADRLVGSAAGMVLIMR